MYSDDLGNIFQHFLYRFDFLFRKDYVVSLLLPVLLWGCDGMDLPTIGVVSFIDHAGVLSDDMLPHFLPMLVCKATVKGAVWL